MRSYFLSLRNKNGLVEEDLGALGCMDDEAALSHASGVVADLVREGAKEYAGWTLEVLENVCRVGALLIA